MATETKAKATQNVNAQEAYLKSDSLGYQYVNGVCPSRHVLAELGEYFVATNPTPGTPIALNAVVTSYADTNAFFILQNRASSGKNLYVDYLKLLLAATAPTAGASLQFAGKIETSTRQASAAANQTILTPVAMNSQALASGSVATPISYAVAGVFTVPASAGSARLVFRTSIPTGAFVAGDEYVLQFGAVDQAGGVGLTAAKATPTRMVGQAPPVCVCPGETLTIYRWGLTEATNAPGYEFELAWWEKAV